MTKALAPQYPTVAPKPPVTDAVPAKPAVPPNASIKPRLSPREPVQHVPGIFTEPSNPAGFPRHLTSHTGRNEKCVLEPNAAPNTTAFSKISRGTKVESMPKGARDQEPVSAPFPKRRHPKPTATGNTRDRLPTSPVARTRPSASGSRTVSAFPTKLILNWSRNETTPNGWSKHPTPQSKKLHGNE